MNSKIIELLAEILDGMSKNYSEEKINKILNDKTEDKSAISVAYSLIYDKVLSKKIMNEKGKMSNLRMLTEEELEIIGMENYNYLLKLLNVGLIDALDLELIIEQLMLVPSETITKEDINLIILLSLVDYKSELLPGSRFLLYTSDTIN